MLVGGDDVPADAVAVAARVVDIGHLGVGADDDDVAASGEGPAFIDVGDSGGAHGDLLGDVVEWGFSSAGAQGVKPWL
jgi:hypothetical protein